MTETLQFYMTDHLQSRTAVLSASGAAVETISYSAWGVSSSSVYGANSPFVSYTGMKVKALIVTGIRTLDLDMEVCSA